MRLMHVLIVGAALMAGGAAQATEAPKPVCAAMDADLPAPFTVWTSPAPIGPSAPAPIGQAITATLSDSQGVAFAVAPERAPKPGTYGAVLRFSVARAGTYAVALGAGAWVDVVSAGQSVASAAHGHGPACSTLRKAVDFKLAPGDYLLQVSDSPTPSLKLMIVRRP